MKPHESNSPVHPESPSSEQPVRVSEYMASLEMRWLTHGGLLGKPFTIHVPKLIAPACLPVVSHAKANSDRVWQNFPRYPGQEEDVVTLEFFWFQE